MRSIYPKVENIRSYLNDSNLENLMLLSENALHGCIGVILATNQHYMWNPECKMWDFLEYGDNKEFIANVHDEAIVIDIIEHKINKTFVVGTEVVVSKEVLIEALDEALKVLNL